MALNFATIALTLLIKCLNAGPVSLPSSNRPCVKFMLPVTVTAKNGVYDVIKVENNIDATAFADAAINPSEKSYVDAALAAGYSILTYDRLGTGLSDKPDADTYLQTALQLQILRAITEMARSGDLLKHTGDATHGTTPGGGMEASNVSFDKVIRVRHSFGSLLSSGLLTTYGNLSDAASITGSVQNPRFRLRATSLGLEYAPENDAKLLSDRSAGYVVWGTRAAIQAGFSSTRANTSTGTGGFEEEVLDYAYSIRQTAGVTEFLSLLGGQLDLGPAVDFKGPVQFVLAEHDFLSCEGDCNGALDMDLLETLYPKAKNISTFIQRGTGHGLTLHKGAKLGYKASLDWLHENGL
ncbi:MAG: hypothetical protein Q9219_006767 [cf. Caloplaca sp. 3 TL-2023]